MEPVFLLILTKISKNSDPTKISLTDEKTQNYVKNHRETYKFQSILITPNFK
jgi:hypothetical protein